MTEKAMTEISWMNANGKRETTDPSRRWRFEHLQAGFRGGRYVWKETDVALDMVTVAQMFCFCHALTDED